MLKECRYCKKEFRKRLLSDVHCSLRCRLLHYSFQNDKGCWVWYRGKDWDGYGIISINDKSDKAHRISYKTFVEDFPENLQVLHKCDNPSCINPDHLFLGSNKDNMHDKIKKGRDRVRGEQSVISKLNDVQVRKLREDFKNGIKYSQLGPKYGITPEQASNIVRRKVWKHLE